MSLRTVLPTQLLIQLLRIYPAAHQLSLTAAQAATTTALTERKTMTYSLYLLSDRTEKYRIKHYKDYQTNAIT